MFLRVTKTTIQELYLRTKYTSTYIAFCLCCFCLFCLFFFDLEFSDKIIINSLEIPANILLFCKHVYHGENITTRAWLTFIYIYIHICSGCLCWGLGGGFQNHKASLWISFVMDKILLFNIATENFQPPSHFSLPRIRPTGHDPATASIHQPVKCLWCYMIHPHRFQAGLSLPGQTAAAYFHFYWLEHMTVWIIPNAHMGLQHINCFKS